MGGDFDPIEGFGQVLGCLVILVVQAVMWLLPLAIGIWILQAAGCV